MTPIPVGNGPGTVAFGNGSVWVANSLDGTVSQIDPASYAVKASIQVGGDPTGIAVTPANRVWVSTDFGDTLVEIDPNRNDSVVLRRKTVNRPQGVTAASKAIYVSVQSSTAEHRGGTLTLLGFPISCCTPTVDLADYDAWITGVAILTNDGLTGFRHVGGIDGTRLVPDLAVALPRPTDHGKTYTFTLRRGIRYSTGALVGPADFRLAIERSLAGCGCGRPGSPYLSGIVGAKTCTSKHCDLSKGIVVDRAANTVTFHLSRPDPDFLYTLALPFTFAVPANTPLKEQPSPLPATGPYTLPRFDAKHEIRLVRNPYFHAWSQAAQPEGYPNVIVYKLTGNGTAQDAAAEVRAVERGQADLLMNPVPTALISEVKTRFAGQTHTSPTLVTRYIPLNTRLPPFNNLKARQALNYALNRNTLAALDPADLEGSPSCQVLPPTLPGYRRYCPYTIGANPSGHYVGPNLAKAKQLVAASGTKGETVTIWTWPGTSPGQIKPTWLQIATYVESVLRRLGYKPRLKAADLYSIGPQTKFQGAVSLGWAADYATGGDFFVPNLTCAAIQNVAGFCNPRIDKEIGQATALQVTNPLGAGRLWSEIDRDVVDQGPWVAYANPETVDFVSRKVGNYVYDPQWGKLIDQMWVR